MMRHHKKTVVLLITVLAAHFMSGSARSADPYKSVIAPFMKTYCLTCHNTEEAKGELDLSGYQSTKDITNSFRKWMHIRDFIRDGEMPPEEAKQPEIGESNAVIDAIRAIMLKEATKHAGDPGVVLPRRLSNTEYNHAIHTLTGVDIRPTHDFPVDPAGGEGFDNTGESLTMSPSLIKKYLAAAQLVSNHMVLRTDGIRFAPYPVTSYSERKKLTEQAIIDFYEIRTVNIRDYLIQAWRFHHREEDEPITIQQWAKDNGLSPKYLSSVYATLTSSEQSTGIMAAVTAAWHSLPPPPDSGLPDELNDLASIVEFGRKTLTPPFQTLIRPGAGNWPIKWLDFRSETAGQRDKFSAKSFTSRQLINTGRIPKPKENDDKPSTIYLRIERGLSDEGGYVRITKPVFSLVGNLPKNEEEIEKHKVQSLASVLLSHNKDLHSTLGFGKHPGGDEIDTESFVVKTPITIEIPLTVSMREELADKQLLIQCEVDKQLSPNTSVLISHSNQADSVSIFRQNPVHLIHSDSTTAESLASSSKQFCNTFPNRFFYVDDQRGLAAGFHLVEGFFRDDQPLVDKVLTDTEKQEIDKLWKELDFATQSIETLLRGFVWFERSERHVLHDERFDFLRSEDPALVEDKLLDKFEMEYLDHMGVPLKENSLDPVEITDNYTMIHGFFQDIRAGLALHNKLLLEAEKIAIRDLAAFAQRAFRRELTPADVDSLNALYGQLRRDGQGVSSSLRGLLIAILMSPEFCYHINDAPDGKGVYEIPASQLASRMSFFLWSTIPDEPLLGTTINGDLARPHILKEQTNRMLMHPNIENFAREFFGQWLRYRDYLEKDAINAEGFEGYDDELRQAIFDEPVKLLTHLIQHDRPITELLNSDVTYVNDVLASHYGGVIQENYKAAFARPVGYGNPLDKWRMVSGISEDQRMGLLGMAIILTKNSKGERTSPVKRGFWIAHHLLGQHFPPPPADVPELPDTEKDASGSIRYLLAEHTTNAKCAMCHKHFDHLGLVLESFDPIGRFRTEDLAGRPIDNAVQLNDGETLKDLPTLVNYILEHRKEAFIQTFCRKFLGYALGRSVILSDQPLLDQIQQELEANEYRFSTLFNTVIQSPQFRMQRGRDFVRTK